MEPQPITIYSFQELSKVAKNSTLSIITEKLNEMFGCTGNRYIITVICADPNKGIRPKYDIQVTFKDVTKAEEFYMFLEGNTFITSTCAWFKQLGELYAP